MVKMVLTKINKQKMLDRFLGSVVLRVPAGFMHPSGSDATISKKTHRTGTQRN